MLMRALASLFNRAGRLEEERRRQVRVECKIPVTIRTGGVCRAATVRDLGYGGLGVEIDEPLPVKTEVVVEREGEGPVRCQVRWCKGRAAGLSYSDTPENFHSSWARRVLKEAGLEPENGGERRREIRARGPLSASISVQDRKTDEVTVADLSRGGALIEVPPEFPLRGRVVLELGPEEDLEKVALMAEVLSSMALDESVSHRLRFTGNRGEDTLLLERYVSLLLLRQVK
ncbi:MAG: PilZ domain-containing protein [Armatimonadetes bacterium]|nr:PilZ domain-containing protein [Armatimonadota bacterium]